MKPFIKTTFLLTFLIILMISVSVPFTAAQTGNSTDKSEPTVANNESVQHSQDEDLRHTIKFKSISVEDGLPSSETQSVLQDRQGFIWIGTAAGLSRYDGMQITTYLHDPDNPNSPGDDYIWDLYEDRAGILWVGGTEGGLNRFDPATQTFTRYVHDENDARSLSHNYIGVIYEDSVGRLWVGTERGLSKFDAASETFTNYQHNENDPNSLSGNAVLGLSEDGAGNLWVGVYGGGLNRFDPETEQFTHYQHDEDDPNSLSNNNVFPLHIDRAGTLWVGTEGGLNKFDSQTESFSHYEHDADNPASLSGNAVTSIYEDQYGALWVGTYSNGLNRFDPDTETFIRYQHDEQNPHSLSNDRVIDIYGDESGTLWVATENGINKHDPGDNRFAHYQSNPNKPNTLSNNEVTAIYVDEVGIAWIGTQNGGLNKIERANNRLTHYQHDEDDPQSLSHNTISAIVPDGQGQLWVGTWGGLNKFDPLNETFTRYQHDPDDPSSLSSDIVVDISLDASGSIWIGSLGDGLNKFDPVSETFSSLNLDPVSETFSHLNDEDFSWIEAVYVASDGTLWISRNSGVARLDLSNETFTSYEADSIDPNSIKGSLAYTIYEDSSRTMWFGTDQGLNKFDEATETFITYQKTDGLAGSQVFGIIEDKQGALWISTNNGISKFDLESETFRTYHTEDGLQGNQFLRRAASISDEGQLFFGGVNGFNTFYPERLLDNANIPPVVLTNFKIFNQSVSIGGDSPLQKDISLTDEIVLAYDQSVLSFEFAALNYRAAEKNQYAYMMDGFDKEWTYVDSSRRFTTYTNLDPGQYTFRVKGSNNDGVWNETGTSVRLIIRPPWWQTTAFRGLMVALVVGLLFGGYRWRVRSIKNRNRELEAQVAQRTRQLAAAKEKAEVANQAKSTFLANMSHELRTPLNAILGFAQIVIRSQTLPKEHVQNLGIISRSGEHLLTLINNVLDLSKIEAGKTTLNEENFDLYRLLDDLQDMFQMAADDKRLQLLFEHTPDVPRYLRTDSLKLRQVLINLLNNAIKFTSEGGVSVRVAAKEGQNGITRLFFEVEDSGAGIASEEIDKLFEAFAQTQTGKQTEEGSGLGLPISRQFVRLMGGKIRVESRVGRGTTFKFNVQVTQVQANDLKEAGRTRRVIALEPNQPRYRILIVDDKSSNRQLLIQLLNPLGFALREASNGREAIEIWEAWEPHLICMDMRMPVMDGYEATKRIKETTKGQATSIIALTASTFEEERAVVLSAGCDDFLRKPFRTNDIFDMMHKHIGVRYIYDEPTSTTGAQEEALTPTALAILPISLLAQLQEAAEGSDLEMIEEVLAQISTHFPALASQLSKLADEFEYDQILWLLEQSCKVSESASPTLGVNLAGLGIT